MYNITLTDDEFEIVRNMVRLIDSLPACPDEILDCEIDEFNELSEKFDA